MIQDGRADEIVQETRLWDESKGETYTMRKKEGLADYRYFPEPDLPPLIVSNEWIEKVQKAKSELPCERRQRYLEMGLSMDDVLVLTDEKEIGDYFDAVLQAGNVKEPKSVANWIMGDITAFCKTEKIHWNDLLLKPLQLIEMIQLIDEGVISGKIAKQILPDLLRGKTYQKEPS